MAAAAVNPLPGHGNRRRLVLQGIITGITPEKAVKNLIKSLVKVIKSNVKDGNFYYRVLHRRAGI